MNIKRIKPTPNIYASESNFLELPKQCFLDGYAQTVVYGLIRVDNIVFFCTIDNIWYHKFSDYYIEDFKYSDCFIQVNFAVVYGTYEKVTLSRDYIKYYTTEELLKMKTAPVQVDVFNPETFKCVKELLYVEGKFINDAMYDLIAREKIKYSDKIINIEKLEDMEEKTFYLQYINAE